MGDNFTDLFKSFLGPTLKVLVADEYEIEIQNDKMDILRITSEGGTGYNAGLSWISVEILPSSNNRIHKDGQERCSTCNKLKGENPYCSNPFHL